MPARTPTKLSGGKIACASSIKDLKTKCKKNAQRARARNSGYIPYGRPGSYCRYVHRLKNKSWPTVWQENQNRSYFSKR